jgi:hypothetical protein
MEYQCISADGMKWVTKAGAHHGYSNGKGAPSAIGGTRKYVPGQSHHPDRMAFMCLRFDVTLNPGIRDPQDTEPKRGQLESYRLAAF